MSVSPNDVEDPGIELLKQEDEDEEDEEWCEALRRPNKGDVSNFVTFFIFLLGVALRLRLPGNAANLILSFGLFGFAGGITNWLVGSTVPKSNFETT